MPKIKDLGSVILDNAVSYFPVDSERYELAAAVRLNAAYCMQHLGVYQHENWRINEWLATTDATVWRAVDAYYDHLSAVQQDAMQADLARRLRAMFDDSMPAELLMYLDDSELFKATLHGAVWKLVSSLMRRSRHFWIGPETQKLFKRGQLTLFG